MIKETSCPNNPENQQHCRHWYDGEACCRCKAPALAIKEKRALGMLEE